MFRIKKLQKNINAGNDALMYAAELESILKKKIKSIEAQPAFIQFFFSGYLESLKIELIKVQSLLNQ